MSAKHVVRWVVTMPWPAGGPGWRTLAHAAQGRHTYATREEAQAWIDAARENTAADTLRSVYGPRGADDLAVNSCLCWGGHFDPVGIYFAPGAGAPLNPIEASP